MAAVEVLMAAGPCPRQSRRHGSSAAWLVLLLVAMVAAGGAAASSGKRLPGSFSSHKTRHAWLRAVLLLLLLSSRAKQTMFAQC